MNREISTPLLNSLLATMPAAKAEAVRRLFSDWQSAYSEIDSHLSCAMRVNKELELMVKELTAQVSDLRQARDSARGELYAETTKLIDLRRALATVLKAGVLLHEEDVAPLRNLAESE